MKKGRDPHQIRVDKEKRGEKIKKEGPVDGTSGASAAYYPIDQRSKVLLVLSLGPEGRC